MPADNLRRWFDTRFPPGPYEIRDPYSSRDAALYTILYNRFGKKSDSDDDYVCRTVHVGKAPKKEAYVLVVVESGEFLAKPKDAGRCFLDHGHSERAQMVRGFLEGMGLGFEQNGIRWCQCPGRYRP